MGWLFKAGFSRRDLIAENTKGWERTKEDGTIIKSTCLAHCYRGGIFSGVLWSVWERTFVKDGQQVEPTQRWIVCDLLRCVQGEWGYKDMEESMHRMALSFGLSADVEPGPGGGMLTFRPVGVDLVGLAALGYEMFGPPW